MSADDKSLSNDGSASGPKKSKVDATRQKSQDSELKTPRKHKLFSDRSTSTAAQRARVLELLKTSPQTTYSLRAKGISHGAARVMELRQSGYSISSTLVNAVDSDGYTHVGVALYSLEVVV